MRTDLAQARATLETTAGRTAELLDSIPNGDLPVTGSQWTVGEVGAHLVVALGAFTQAAAGFFDAVSPCIPDTEVFGERLSAVTAGTLQLVPERAPGALAELVLDAARTFLATTAGRSPDHMIRTPWYGSQASLSLGAATGLLVGEQILHGYDVAKTVRRRWPISTADAALMLHAVTAMLPLAVNPETARGFTASYEVRARGVPRFVVRFRDGVATMEPTGGQTVDCRLSAEPVDLMLVAYGRISQWGPIARGRLRAWGRKPWLGLKFTSLFVNP
ncbi:MAG: maleylpyruvate isomerase N-terminal domain-containing protein [Pseudonocardiaceae bacterium]